MSHVDVENASGISRATCGWRLPHLDLEDVWRYWRDVHSPAISRRVGMYQYRHYQWYGVDPELFGPVDGVELAAAPGAQLQWLSDVVYRDQAGLDAFYRSPETPELVSRILADIEMIVDRSTTYLTVADNMHTYRDLTGDPAPQGVPSTPHFGVLLRQGEVSDEAFRAALRDLAASWAARDGVLRVRLNLFDRPDMAADASAGYPVKTHPVEQQYQAWIDLVVTDRAVGAGMLDEVPAGVLRAAHAYAVSNVYTFVFDGVPTLVALRGYPAYAAIEALGAEHARQLDLLRWMYGSVVDGAVPQEVLA